MILRLRMRCHVLCYPYGTLYSGRILFTCIIGICRCQGATNFDTMA